MLTSKRARGCARPGAGRFLLQVAFGAVLVVGLIALMVSCAAVPPAEEVGTTSSPLTIAGLFPTGVDAGGTPLAIGATDPHYVLTSDDPAHPGPAAIVVTPAAGWTGNTATSNWISVQPSAVGTANKVYTYTTTFTLAGVDPASATLSGSWACDDSCALMLNGMVVATATYAAPAWNAVGTFTVPAGSPFVTGANTLAFAATNSGGGATGLQVVSISGTALGCTADNQCLSAQFCNTQTATCEGALPSGTPIPVISGHTPVLDGTCTTDVGAAVCDAGVCDMTNNECGLANGSGPCTAANGSTLCQSGACSENGTCEPSGGCNVDGDCAAGTWCDEATNTCSPKLPDGAAIPDDPGHMAPTLDGTCNVGAATLVCQSALCSVTSNTCVQCLPTAAGACTGSTPVCGPSDVCVASLDGGEDGSAGVDGGDAEAADAADGSEGMDGSQDGSASADGSEDGSEEGSAGADGSASEDGSADADAGEPDAAEAAAPDAGRSQGEGGASVHKELEGGGLSCSASAAQPRDSGGAPLVVLLVTLAAAFGRGRRGPSAGRGRCVPSAGRGRRGPSAGERRE
jgi:hypothetical protein